VTLRTKLWHDDDGGDVGALPLAIGFGEGAELRRPLGLTVVGRLLVGQLLILYTTPVIYLYFDRFRAVSATPVANPPTPARRRGHSRTRRKSPFALSCVIVIAARRANPRMRLDLCRLSCIAAFSAQARKGLLSA